MRKHRAAIVAIQVALIGCGGCSRSSRERVAEQAGKAAADLTVGSPPSAATLPQCLHGRSSAVSLDSMDIRWDGVDGTNGHATAYSNGRRFLASVDCMTLSDHLGCNARALSSYPTFSGDFSLVPKDGDWHASGTLRMSDTASDHAGARFGMPSADLVLAPCAAAPTASRAALVQVAGHHAARDSAGDGSEPVQFNQVDSSCLTPRQRAPVCSFYRECLEAAIPCEGTEWPYSISYGERYCLAFQEASPKLSNYAQQWRAETTYCLQTSVPLTDYGTPRVASCEDVYRAEFGAHANCYVGLTADGHLSPDRQTSICYLDLADLWVLKGIIDTDDLFSLDGMAQMLSVGETCAAVAVMITAPSPTRSTSTNDRVAFWNDWQQWARTKIAAQQAQTPLAGGYVLPAGDYHSSCRNCGVTWRNVLSCECEKAIDDWVPTELANWNSCPAVSNCGGRLTCGECTLVPVIPLGAHIGPVPIPKAPPNSPKGWLGPSVKWPGKIISD